MKLYKISQITSVNALFLPTVRWDWWIPNQHKLCILFFRKFESKTNTNWGRALQMWAYLFAKRLNKVLMNRSFIFFF